MGDRALAAAELQKPKGSSNMVTCNYQTKFLKKTPKSLDITIVSEIKLLSYRVSPNRENGEEENELEREENRLRFPHLFNVCTPR